MLAMATKIMTILEVKEVVKEAEITGTRTMALVIENQDRRHMKIF